MRIPRLIKNRSVKKDHPSPLEGAPTFDRIKGIVAKFTEEEVTSESSLVGDLGLTSFDLVSIVAEFEDEFDMEIPDRDILGFITIQDVLDYLEKNGK